MTRRYGFAVLLTAMAAVFVTHGCDCTGSSSIALSADPTEIAADGISSTVITARVIYRDSTVEDGTTVAFETNNGSFDTAGSNALKSSSETAAGNAKITLYSSTTTGDAVVNASYTTQNEEVITASITIKFVKQSTVSMRNFDFTCNSRNISAFDPSLPKIQVVCPIKAQTANGTPVLRPQVKFLTESGTMKLVAPEDTTQPSYAIYTADGIGPDDVDPNSDEPSVTDDTGRVRNPRDGLVTVIAYVDGDEAYVDTNGNGQYDEGESFQDIGEPFVDKNDNGVWDPGEPFVDVNGNNQYDGPNAHWDGQTQIWKASKILWTGRMKQGTEYSNIQPSTLAVPHHGSEGFTVKVVDENLNPLASNDQDDYLTIELDGGKCVECTDKSCKNSFFPGMTIVKGVNGDDTVQGGYDQQRTWTVTVSDSLDHPDAADGGKPYESTLKAQMSYTPGPKEQETDQYLDRVVTDWMAVTGMIQ